MENLKQAGLAGQDESPTGKCCCWARPECARRHPALLRQEPLSQRCVLVVSNQSLFPFFPKIRKWEE